MTNYCFNVVIINFSCIPTRAGIVLAFFSGQQIFESVNEFEDTVDNTFDLTEIFINDSVDVS